MEREKQQQILMELITTALILLFYWISMQPDWRLEMWLTAIKRRLTNRAPVVNPRIRAEIEKFRQEISAWEHEERRKRNAG